jgi:ArsR family transcriptional regulator
MSLDPKKLFGALADATRLRLLVLLTAEGELCVCELTHALKTSQPKISRHLATLREMDLVVDRRVGQWIYYRLHPGLPTWTQHILKETLAGMIGTKLHASDRQALKRMPNRPNAVRCCA